MIIIHFSNSENFTKLISLNFELSAKTKDIFELSIAQLFILASSQSGVVNPALNRFH